MANNYQNKSLALGCALVLSLLSVSAIADELPAPQSNISLIDEVSRIDAKIFLMRKELELKSFISSLGEKVSLPNVISIIKQDGKPQAQILFDNGIARWVTVGESVGKGFVVKKISNSGVVVGRDNQTFDLDFITRQSSPEGGDQNNMTHIPAASSMLMQEYE